MRRRRLGSEGPDISVIGFGAWEAGGVAWGPNPPEQQTVAALKAAFEEGMDWVDTAEIYGEGRSEKLVGKAVEGYDHVRVFTKVAPKPRGSGFDAPSIRRAAQASLNRLGREVIDLYQLHMPDPEIPVEESWEEMARLKQDGMVRRLGLSNYPREAIERCEQIEHVDCLQPHFSMLWRVNQPVFSFCRDNGTGVICYGPLAFGLLTGTVGRDTQFSRDDWRSGSMGLRAYDQLFRPGRLEWNLEVVEALRPIAERLGMTPAQLALAWVLHQEGVTGAIAGSRSAEHVIENARASDRQIGGEDMDEIERILEGARAA